MHLNVEKDVVTEFGKHRIDPLLSGGGWVGGWVGGLVGVGGGGGRGGGEERRG